MTRQLISSGSKFESEMAYSRAMVDGDWIFVSGTTGFNYAGHDDFRRCRRAGRADASSISRPPWKRRASRSPIWCRVHYILPNAADFPACCPAMRKHLGEVRPAATMLVAGLVDPRMKIEIEVTGKRRG